VENGGNSLEAVRCIFVVIDKAAHWGATVTGVG